MKGGGKRGFRKNLLFSKTQGKKTDTSLREHEPGRK